MQVELLKKRILDEGRPLSPEVLIVDMFLNHQVDCALMDEIGREFARLFASDGVTRIATIEASGIAPTAMTALHMGLPMVILKKSPSLILNKDVLQTEVYSFTKQSSYMLTLKGEYIKKGDRVLLIDDFLANGEAATGAAELIKQAGGEVAGIGIVICKSFQPGLKKLKSLGYHVEALAKVSKMDKGYIEFED